MMKKIIAYHTENGITPIREWLNSLSDKRTVTIILNRIKRLQVGNFGDCKSLGGGISELRIHYGPGFRIYYSMIGNVVILLINGGDKSTQSQDIEKAKQYLEDYKYQTKGN